MFNFEKKSLKRTIKTTLDGSKTLFINDLEESYHSINGALNEANHVFIDNGFKLLKNCDINILELGFGTGLNVLVTINEYLKTDKSHVINFYSLEKYPIAQTEIEELNYNSLFDDELMNEIYLKIHDSKWEESVEIIPNFYLTKFNCDFYELPKLNMKEIDLVYFDCFGAKIQPDLWEKLLVEMVSKKMKEGSLLTTYSSKGSFRRILEELNFKIEKKAGPKGKREMINAWLLNN